MVHILIIPDISNSQTVQIVFDGLTDENIFKIQTIQNFLNGQSDQFFFLSRLKSVYSFTVGVQKFLGKLSGCFMIISWRIS